MSKIKNILFLALAVMFFMACDNASQNKAASTTDLQTKIIVVGGGVSINYAIADDWGAGFVTNVTITNTGTTAIDGWTIEWDFPGNQTIVNSWNGVLSQVGTHVTVSNYVWNGTIQPTQSVSFGFQGTYSGANLEPDTFIFNGVVIGQGVKPTVTITAPLTGTQVLAGSAITIEATAADTDGTVSKVDFYNGTTLLGTDTTAPYSYTIASAAKGTYTLRAIATDNDNLASDPSVVIVTAVGTEPVATITAPSNNASYNVGENIIITATATDSNGTVTKVDFYNGTTLLGTDTSAPYSYTITNALKGTYALKAIATDNSAETGESSIVTVKVIDPNDVVELVQNGDFSKLGYYWKKRDHYQAFMNSQRVAESAMTVVNGVCEIDVKNRGTASWNLHLMQPGIHLEQGASYVITFDAKTNLTTDITMDVAIKKIVTDWKSYVPKQDPPLFGTQEGHAVKVNSTLKTYTIPFTMTHATDPYANLEFNHGLTVTGEPGQFILSIDNVSVKKTSDNVDPRIRTLGTGIKNPVADNGDLSVANGKVVNAAGVPYQLRGMSTHGMQWEGVNYSNREVMIETKDKWNASVFRLGMYLGQGGYLENNSIKYEMMRAIEDAIEVGMYIIIDWHIHNEQGNPNATAATIGGKTYNFKQEAIDFFEEMAIKYGAYDNVIFEIANEPNTMVGNGSWSEIKQYAEAVIPVIRAHSNNLIIVGTPTWSQDVDIATATPLTGANAVNIAYSFHFYANTHSVAQYSPKIETALSRGYAIFVSEWGTPDASGNGAMNTAESEKWLDWLAVRDIGWVNWHISDEEENSAAIRLLELGTIPIPSQTNGWSDADLRPSGLFVKQQMLK